MDDFDWIRDSSLELPKNREELKHFIGWYFIWDESCGRKCNGSWGHSGRKWLINEIGYQVNFTDTFTNEKINYNVITFINNLLTGSWVLVSPEGVLLDPLYNRTYNPRLTESEEDDFDWIREVKPSMPAKDLKPGDRFMITQIKGKSLKEYLKDHDLREVDPYTTVFKLDDSDNFSAFDGGYTDYYTEDVDDIWLKVDNKPQSGWVNVHEIMVTLV